jgi:hypothetical protein
MGMGEFSTWVYDLFIYLFFLIWKEKGKENSLSSHLQNYLPIFHLKDKIVIYYAPSISYTYGEKHIFFLSMLPLFYPLNLFLSTPFGRGERNGIEWKKKEYFKNILSFPLFGSLSRREWKGMERPFPCLGV